MHRLRGVWQPSSLLTDREVTALSRHHIAGLKEIAEKDRERTACRDEAKAGREKREITPYHQFLDPPLCVSH